MEWMKKNWLWLILVTISALPILEIITSLTINFSGQGPLFQYNIPERIREMLERSGRQLSPWGMPLHSTGEWAIRFLVITLTCTPLCILFRNPKIARYKKVFGIYTFIYSLLHFVLFLADYDFLLIFEELNFILALVATIIIVPLGITSNKFSMRLLKKKWKSIQRLAYAAGIAAVLHLALLGKGSWVLYTIILLLGFVLRIPDVKRYIMGNAIKECSIETEGA
jgi:sulfoxide reductase heme-binding subunit YedZ